MPPLVPNIHDEGQISAVSHREVISSPPNAALLILASFTCSDHTPAICTSRYRSGSIRSRPTAGRYPGLPTKHWSLILHTTSKILLKGETSSSYHGGVAVGLCCQRNNMAHQVGDTGTYSGLAPMKIEGSL